MAKDPIVADDAAVAAAAKRAELLAQIAALETENPAIVPQPYVRRRFQVLHGAVSGHALNGSGVWSHTDFPMGSIVDEANLDPNLAVLFSLGAIVEVE